MGRRQLRNGFSMLIAEPPPKPGLRLRDLAEAEHEHLGFTSELKARLGLAAADDALLDHEIVAAEFAPRKRRRRRRRSFLHTQSKTGQWSGIVSPCPAGDRLVGVSGQWRMPNVTTPAHATLGATYAASFWTGIDGDLGTSDVLQAGCDGDITAGGAAARPAYKPWYEWYPGLTEWITTLNVSAGDLLRCLITADPVTATRATIVLANDTTQQVVQPFTIQAPQNRSLAGNCAEWIVEGFGTLGPMALFDPVQFDVCSGRTAAGALVSPATGKTLNIMDGGLPVAIGALAGTTGVRVICI